MLEGFKINCYPLNRAIRVSIHLPKDYNNTGRYYPAIYMLDGQNLYNDNDSYTGKSLELESTIQKLTDIGKDAIYIGIAAASNKEKRDAEYDDKILADFIITQIHPYILSRYRINKYIYSFACAKACYTALCLSKSEAFKGAVIISPEGKIDKIKDLNLDNNKLYYLYAGEKENNSASKILVVELHLLLPNAITIYDNNMIHNEEAWRDKLFDIFDAIIL